MSKAKVLVVEDEAIVAADICDSLRNLGYNVCAVATSGLQAVEKTAESKPELVLMDIKLKGEMDGIAAATAIRQQYDIPVVYLTAHGDEGTLERAKNTSPAGYVLKPFAEMELRIALELALFRYRKEGANSAAYLPGNLTQSTAAAKSTRAPEEQSSPEPAASGTKPLLEKLKFLNQIKPFSQLDDHSLQLLSAGCHFQRYSTAEIILHENDRGGQGFIVCSGRIALLKTSASGRQLIVELLPPGDVFGLAICIDEQDFPLTARAQVPAELLWIPRDVFRRYLEVYPSIYHDLISMISQRLRRSYSLSRALAHDRVEVRIASALTALVPRFGALDSEKGIPKIAITRQELADLTGTSVETAIRVCKNLEREKILELSETGMVRIVNSEKLAHLIME